jgi:uncharacterized protein YifE (UPF0438 family)
MANCGHNQLESLAMRYLKQTPDVEGANLDVDLLIRIIDQLAADVREHYKPEFNFNAYVKTKSGAVRRRYLKAYKQLADGELDITKNSRISAFVKNERYFEEGKSPRSIMGRDPKFNIIYARFISRYEDAFFKLDQVCNACDFRKCGEKFERLIRKSMAMFENDMSKFEATQRFFILLLEYLVLLRVTPEHEHDDLTKVFAAKIMKPVVYQSGVRADFENCRGSGDLDTGSGNGTANYISTVYFKIINFCKLGSNCKLKECNCGCYDFALKGDDSYGTDPTGGTRPLINTYKWFGFDAKLVSRPDGRLTEFCSGHFIRVAGGYTYVQKLRKVITSVATCINPDTIKNGWLGHYLRSLGDMYAVLYDGVPVYEDFAKMLRTAHGKAINMALVEGISYGAVEAFKLRNSQKVDAVPETLLDISLVNDMPLAQLGALSQTFTLSNIVLPAHLMRRCNTKVKDSGKWCDLDSIFASTVKGFKLSKRAGQYRKLLSRARSDPREAVLRSFNFV